MVCGTRESRAPKPHRASSSRPRPNARIGFWWLYLGLDLEVLGVSGANQTVLLLHQNGKLTADAISRGRRLVAIRA